MGCGGPRVCGDAMGCGDVVRCGFMGRGGAVGCGDAMTATRFLRDSVAMARPIHRPGGMRRVDTTSRGRIMQRMVGDNAAEALDQPALGPPAAWGLRGGGALHVHSGGRVLHVASSLDCRLMRHSGAKLRDAVCSEDPCLLNCLTPLLVTSGALTLPFRRAQSANTVARSQSALRRRRPPCMNQDIGVGRNLT